MRCLAREGVSQRRQQPEDVSDAAEPSEAQPERQAMRQALAGLDADQRHLLVLHYFADLTVPQLARALDAGEDTVSTRLSRALAQLREQLEPRSAQEAANHGS